MTVLPWPAAARSSRSRRVSPTSRRPTSRIASPSPDAGGRRPGRAGELRLQLARGPAGHRAELAPQGLVHALELTQRRSYVASIGVLPGQREVGLLVSGVRPDEVLPPSREPEQVLVQDRQRLAPRGRPGLVQVLGQQRPGVRREHPLRLGCRSGRQCGLGPATEVDGVDGDLGIGKQEHQVVAQQQRGGLVAEGTACVVRGLVQPRHRGLDGQVRPERVHHLLAVHPAALGQRQHLHQGCGPTSAPRDRGDDGVSGRDREAPEQRDRDVHVGASAGARPIRPVHATPRPRAHRDELRLESLPHRSAGRREATPAARPRRSWPR